LLTLSCARVARTMETVATGNRTSPECEQLNAPVPIEEEYALGGAVALNWVQRGGGLLPVDKTHEPLLRYLNIVGRNLGAQSPRPTLQWTFGVLQNEKAFDATSAPGGYVFVTLGLLQGLENEAELAGVLAHEIAHITSKHALTRYNQVKVSQCNGGKFVSGFSQLSQRALPGVQGAVNRVAGALDLDHDIDLLGNLAGGLMDKLVAQGFGEHDEFDADEQAVRLLISAGYNPWEYVRFIGKIPDRGNSFGNHPQKVERVKRLVTFLERSASPAPGGEDFPELAANPKELAQPPLPPEFASVKGAVARDKP
ncbi:M48 family metalloprotease, partial [Hyalangium sp.]|uniref:M48 family metalloprotease n=1 Tax=Hyalangium sp. TaxID=2028555 RepID=UPI002D368B8B